MITQVTHARRSPSRGLGSRKPRSSQDAPRTRKMSAATHVKTSIATAFASKRYPSLSEPSLPITVPAVVLLLFVTTCEACSPTRSICCAAATQTKRREEGERRRQVQNLVVAETGDVGRMPPPLPLRPLRQALEEKERPCLWLVHG